MSRRLTWLLTSLVGLVVVAGAASFAPRALPAAPPPVRLEGSLVDAGSVSQNELIVVPTPSVELGDSTTSTTTTTTSPTSGGAQVDDGESPAITTPEEEADDVSDSASTEDTSEDSDDGSADTADDGSADTGDDD